jgi:hypothetical protein
MIVELLEASLTGAGDGVTLVDFAITAMEFDDSIASTNTELEMARLVSFDFLQLLATVFLGVVGMAFTILQARNARRQNTLTLYEKWDAQELSQYRSVVWDVWTNLKHGKDETVIRWLGGDYFGMSIQEIDQRIPEHQTHAVRSLLNYFASVYEYQKLGLTDRKVTVQLFWEPWLWWGSFFILLNEKVESHLRAKGLPESEWAASSFITTLNRVAALDQVIRRP